MRSRTSFFNPTLFLFNVKRLSPLWAGYCAVILAALPGYLLARYLQSPVLFQRLAGGHFAADHAYSMAGFCVLVSAAAGCLFAMGLFSYLYQQRSAVALHSLPLRRECLFFTNYISGLVFFAAPILVTIPVTLGVDAYVGQTDVKSVFLWAAVSFLAAVFFFSFAVFCAMFTGNILALPAFYIILNGLAYGLYALAVNLFELFIYGFNTMPGGGVAQALSPALALYANIHSEYIYGPEGPTGAILGCHLAGLPVALIYAGAGLLLAAAALLLYRRRQIESAGDIVSVKIVRPIFKYGFSFCCAVAFATLCYSLFWATDDPNGIWMLLAFLLFFAIVGFFAADMVLHKSFHVFSRRNAAGCAVVCAVLAAVTLGAEFDLTGYERNVPDPAQVESVTVTGFFTAPYDDNSSQRIFKDPDSIALVTGLHQTLIRDKGPQELARFQYRTNGFSDYVKLDEFYGQSVSHSATNSTGITLHYTMTDGRTLERSYECYLFEDDLGNSESVTARLQALANHQPELKESYFPSLAERTDAEVMSGSISMLTAYAEDNSWYDISDRSLTQEEAALLWQAVQADLEAGDLGRQWYFENEDYETTVYAGQVSFYLRWPEEALDLSSGARTTYGSTSVYLSLTTECTNSLAALEALGITPVQGDDGYGLITCARRDALYAYASDQYDGDMEVSTTNAG